MTRLYFYPRPPGGGRQLNSFPFTTISHFYPRPPGGGRQQHFFLLMCLVDFYPRPPGGGRLSVSIVVFSPVLISIHALRVEGDRFPSLLWLPGIRFLSTPSGWRATSAGYVFLLFIEFLSTPSGWRATCNFACHFSTPIISIHALRVEGDCWKLLMQHTTRNFYPRPPGGGRRRSHDFDLSL